MDWLKDENSKKILLEAVQRFTPMLEKELKENGVQAMVEFVYFNLDNMLEKSGLKKQFTCSKGCNFCCNSEITISSYEASFIYSFIEQMNVPVNYKQLKKLNEVGIDNLPFKQKACPLLDDKGACSIYEIRPSICRIHGVINNPKYCDFSKYKGRSKMGRIIETYALTSALVVLDSKLNKFAEPVELHKVLHEYLTYPIRD